MTESTIMNLKPFQKGWFTNLTMVREFVVQRFKNRKGEPLQIKKVIGVDKEVKTIYFNYYSFL